MTFELCVGIVSVSILNQFVHHLIFPIFVVVVFVDLPIVIGWVANNHEHRRFLLFPNALGILRREKHQLWIFYCLKCINKTNALKGFIAACCIVKMMLDIH